MAKETTIKEIQQEEEEFLGEKLQHKQPQLFAFCKYENITAELMIATPYSQWINGATYATFATWDCECCHPIDKMDWMEKEKRLLDMLSKRPISVALESASFTWRLTGISRAITHQIVRHRKMAFGQQSLRVSNPGWDPIRIPIKLWSLGDKQLLDRTKNAMSQIKELYFDLVEAGVPPEQARNVLPIGITTKISMVMTLRDMIDYFKARTSGIAQDEHTYVVELMMKELKERQPQYYEFVMSKLGGRK